MRPSLVSIPLALMLCTVTCTTLTTEAHPHARFHEFGIDQVTVIVQDDTKNSSVTVAPIQASIEGLLISRKGYDVVTRSQLDLILEEQRLSLSEIVRQPSQLGMISNIDGILIVEVNRLLKSGRSRVEGTITASLLSVESGDTCFTDVCQFKCGASNVASTVAEAARRIAEDIPPVQEPESSR